VEVAENAAKISLEITIDQGECYHYIKLPGIRKPNVNRNQWPHRQAKEKNVVGSVSSNEKGCVPVGENICLYNIENDRTR
jgi:hypothetical protein